MTGQTLVFTRTKHGADKVVKSLHHAGLSAEAIHGNKSQNQRERVLGAFRAGKLKTLVATDIAARGIDVEGISHVINYDLPNIPESYVHRIGRTARAGAAGIAISFCDNEERAVPARHREADPDEAPGDGPALGAERSDRQPAKHHRPQQARGQQQNARRPAAALAASSRTAAGQQNRGGHQQNAWRPSAAATLRQSSRTATTRNGASIRRRPIRAPQRAGNRPGRLHAPRPAEGLRSR